MNMKTFFIACGLIAAMMVPACAAEIPQGACLTSNDGLWHIDNCNAHHYRCTDDEWQMIINHDDDVDVDTETPTLMYDEEHNLLMKLEMDGGWLDVIKNTNGSFFSDLWNKTKTNISVPTTAIRLLDASPNTTSVTNSTPAIASVDMLDLIPENDSDMTLEVSGIANATYQTSGSDTFLEVDRTSEGMLYVNDNHEMILKYDRGDSKTAGANVYVICVSVYDKESKTNIGEVFYAMCDADDNYLEVNLGTDYSDLYTTTTPLVAVGWQYNNDDNTNGYVCEFIHGQF